MTSYGYPGGYAPPPQGYAPSGYPPPGYSAAPSSYPGYPPPASGYPQPSAYPGYPPPAGYGDPAAPAAQAQQQPAAHAYAGYPPAPGYPAYGQPGYEAYYQQQQQAYAAAYYPASGYPPAPPPPSQQSGGRDKDRGSGKRDKKTPALKDEDSQDFVVTGCTHDMVGGIVRGNFAYHSENHGKPVYKKDSRANGLDVMLYFWDDRDGPNFCGWWFGPKVGGDKVWAYHPDSKMKKPPSDGWKVPYDGSVDPTLSVKSGRGSSSAKGSGSSKRSADSRGQQPEQRQTKHQRQQLNQVREEVETRRKEEQKRQQDNQHKQAEVRAKVIEENRKKLEEGKKTTDSAKKQQQESHEAMLAQIRLQQEELKREREAEALKRMEEQTKMREENRAVLVLRKVIQKLKLASLDNFDVLKKELDEVQEKELENCGTQKSKIEDECVKALQQVWTRIELVQVQSKQDEEQRLEFQRQQEARETLAKETAQDLENLLLIVEPLIANLKVVQEPLEAVDSDLTMHRIEMEALKVSDACEKATAASKAVSDCISEKGSTLNPWPSGQARAMSDKTELKERLEAIMKRVAEGTTGATAAIASAKHVVEQAKRRALAKKQLRELENVFASSDKDGDGFLNRTEVQAHAKKIYSFDLSDEALDQLWSAHVPDGVKGVPLEKLVFVTTAVGLARGRVRDLRVRAEKEKRQKELEELKLLLEEKVKLVAKSLDEMEETVANSEEKARALKAEAKTLSAFSMTEVAATVDQLIKDASASVERVKENIEEQLSPKGADSGLEEFLKTESAKLNLRAGKFDGRLAAATRVIAGVREEITTKRATELESVFEEVVAALRYHQGAKQLSAEKLFEEIDADKDGSISSEDFVAFFGKCERKPKEQPAIPDGETKAEAASDEKSSKDLDPLGGENLSEYFSSLADEDGKLAKEKFVLLIASYMKVMKDTVITDGLDLKESQVIRRLEQGEVLEVIERPKKEESTSVLRIFGKVMTATEEGEAGQGVEGWVTVSGTQGTAFLEEGGNFFKVVKETIFTNTLELEMDKDSSRRLKVAPRKLKAGEILEVHEWPRKEEKSGLTRMKGKLQSDGKIGWVTITGNSGTIFLEVV